MNRIFPKGTEPEQIAQAVFALSRRLDTGKSWQVTLQEYRPRRTDAQNAYLWGVAYPMFLDGHEALRGWTKDDLHQFFLMEHFGEETLEIAGKQYHKPLRRSSRLNKQEFSDYIEFLNQRAAELGLWLPEPGEHT